MDPHHLDGNGIAGLLAELTGADLTAVVRTCPSCGAARAIGEHPAYRSAGVVLRCPSCHDVALVIGVLAGRPALVWHATREDPGASTARPGEPPTTQPHPRSPP